MVQAPDGHHVGPLHPGGDDCRRSLREQPGLARGDTQNHHANTQHLSDLQLDGTFLAEPRFNLLVHGVLTSNPTGGRWNESPIGLPQVAVDRYHTVVAE